MALQFAMLVAGLAVEVAGLWLTMRYRRRPVPRKFDADATPAAFFAAAARHQATHRWAGVGQWVLLAGAMLMVAADNLQLLQSYIHDLHL